MLQLVVLTAKCCYFTVGVACKGMFLIASYKMCYRKIPKTLDFRKLCCNLPNIQKKRPNLRVFHQKGANRIANNEAPDQTAPLGAV